MGLVSVLLVTMQMLALTHARLAVLLYRIATLALPLPTAQHARLGMRLTPLLLFVISSLAKLLIALIATLLTIVSA